MILVQCVFTVKMGWIFRYQFYNKIFWKFHLKKWMSMNLSLLGFFVVVNKDMKVCDHFFGPVQKPNIKSVTWLDNIFSTFRHSINKLTYQKGNWILLFNFWLWKCALDFLDGTMPSFISPILTDTKKLEHKLNSNTDKTTIHSRQNYVFLKTWNIASEASYVYILRRQKLMKNAKKSQFWRVI